MKRLFWMAAVLISACSGKDLPDAFRLQTFRVLALIADHPEVNPGDTVVITPFLSDPVGEAGSVTYSAEGCLDPGVGVGAVPSCDGSPTRTVWATEASVIGFDAPNFTGAVTSTISVTVPAADVVFAAASDQTRFNGVNYLVRVNFKLATGDVVRSFRQIAVSTRPIKNTNPTYSSTPLVSNGSAVTAPPSAGLSLNPDLIPGFKESYDELQPDGSTVSKDEKVETSWYISDGDLSLSVTDDAGATFYTPATGGNTVIVIVTRDNRGGVAAWGTHD